MKKKTKKKKKKKKNKKKEEKKKNTEEEEEKKKKKKGLTVRIVYFKYYTNTHVYQLSFFSAEVTVNWY